MMSSLKNQSNPFSTGGGGVNFETRVQASFVLSMLTESSIPCLPQGYKAKKVKLQGKYAGYDTDDFLLFAESSKGSATLYAQIKHEITISSADDSTFCEVVGSAWADFKRSNFRRDVDAIALITGPLSKKDVNHVRPILEWARHSSSAEEFMTKINAKGFSSKAKLEKFEAIKTQLFRANQQAAISDQDLWIFLKCFHLIAYDLDVESGVTYHLLNSLIAQNSQENPDLVWSKLVTSVQDYNQNAGTIDINSIPGGLVKLFRGGNAHDWEEGLRVLQGRGEYISDDIKSTVGGYQVSRPDYLLSLSSAVDEIDFIFVTGGRGVGKSGIVKEFTRDKLISDPVFYFRAEDFDKPHLNDVFVSIGINLPLKKIEANFVLIPQKYLIIESLEKILELNSDRAFVDLLQMTGKGSGWTVIATGRDYAYQQLAFNYLQPRGINFETLSIDGFSETDIEEITNALPKLQEVSANESLRGLLRNPFFVDIAVRVVEGGGSFSAGDSEKEFRKSVWDIVIAKEADRSNGMHIKRRKVFINIAVQRAKIMLYGVPERDFDPEVVARLEEDSLITRDEERHLVSPVHDVFEDWALEEYIQQEYFSNHEDPSQFLTAIGSEPAINRAFRLWLYQKLVDGDDVIDFIVSTLRSSGVASHWKDETIAAILQSPSPASFLALIENDLLADDCFLLKRFCFILRITGQRPDTRYGKASSNTGLIHALILQPYGLGWSAVLYFLHDHSERLPDSMYPHVIELLSEWSSLLNVNEKLPDLSRIVGVLSLRMLEPLKDSYRENPGIKKLIPVLIKTSSTIETEFEELLNQDVFISKKYSERLHYVDYFSGKLFVGTGVPFLCKRQPALLAKLAFHEWIKPPPDDDDEWAGYSSLDVDDYFGLKRERDFFPASGAKGPFSYLLSFHPRKGLDFIIKLCNITATNYAESDFSSPERGFGGEFPHDELVAGVVSVPLNDGSIVDQFASPHLWKGYRGMSTLPYLLQSALMALENWLVEYIQLYGESDQIEWLFDYVLRSSNSVMTTSVLASIAIGHPEKIGKSCFPLLKTPELYSFDLQRSIGEMGGNETNWFYSQFHRDPMQDIYVEDRKVAALRPWRKESLEHLLIRLQLIQDVANDTLDVVDYLAVEALKRPDNDALRFMLHRADTRKWEATADQENNRVILENKNELDSDLQEIRDSFNEEHADDGNITKLNLWARKAFDRENDPNQYYDSYQKALDVAIDLEEKLKSGSLTSDFARMSLGAIATTAAVCIRDGLENISEESIFWCIDFVAEVVTVHADLLDSIAASDATDSYGSAACASVLPIIFDFISGPDQILNLKTIIAIAITHVDVNVQAHAAIGIRDYLWSRDKEFAKQCMAGAVEFSAFIKKDRFSGGYGL